jgi:ATP-binding cassette subfamily B protein RaxB
MQHDTLFNGSIAENISFYDEETDFDLLKQSAAKAAIDLEIEKMPMRYHTRVGDQGASLSGGQRQRVLLARAFYRSAKIFVLDEATSHLDVENEHKVNQSIKASKATRIFVAHRPETIRTADRIIDISAGADLISLSA